MPIVIGIGMSSFATMTDMMNALSIVKDLNVTAMATLKKKETNPLLIEAQKILSVPLFGFTSSELDKMKGMLKNPSDHVFDHIGCHSVAEAACLKACGEGARLIIEKTKFGGMTIAVAQQEHQ